MVSFDLEISGGTSLAAFHTYINAEKTINKGGRFAAFVDLLHLYRCNIIITYRYNKVNRSCTCMSAENIRRNLCIMNKDIEKRVGNNVRFLREKAGVTQEQLAARLQIQGCDITRSAVAKIEVGQRHLYPDEVILIKSILGVSYDDIFNIQ